jgi:hypothetical protein
MRVSQPRVATVVLTRQPGGGEAWAGSALTASAMALPVATSTALRDNDLIMDSPFRSWT